MKARTSLHYFFISSCLLHVLLITLLLLTYQQPPLKINIGKQKSAYITAYLMNLNQQQSAPPPGQASKIEAEKKQTPMPIIETKSKPVTIVQKRPIPQQTTKTTISKRPIKVATHKVVKKQTPSLPTIRSQSSKGDTIKTLRTLLNQAITAKRIYPNSAIRLGRTGRVTVRFYLFTDGSIQQLNILKTSGTRALDLAALHAVENAAPFTQAKPYIEKSGEYTVDIVFDLT